MGEASANIICNELGSATKHFATEAGRGLLEGGLMRVMTQTADSASEIADVKASMDIFFMLFCAYLVFLMQAGFAMLCAGAVRSKNTVNILLKNVMDACGGAISYW